jgi:hypothetical protein
MNIRDELNKAEAERDERLRKIYIAEGWGALAIEAGFDPVHTESSARSAFAFCAEKIAKLEAENRKLRDAARRGFADVVKGDRPLSREAAKALAKREGATLYYNRVLGLWCLMAPGKRTHHIRPDIFKALTASELTARCRKLNDEAEE